MHMLGRPQQPKGARLSFPDCPSVSIIETDDVDDQRRSLSCWDQDYAQLSAGAFHGRTTEVDFGAVRIFREQLSAITEQVFAPPEGTITLSLHFHCTEPSRIAGIEVGSDHFCLLPGGRQCHAITAHDSDILCVELDESLICPEDMTGPPKIRRHPVRHAPQTARTAWWLSSVLECCRAGQSTPVDDEDFGLLADLVRESCVGLLRHSNSGQHSRDRLGARFDLVMRARQVALSALPETLDVAEIAERLRVSERLLEESFRDIVGMGPATWLRLQRLNRAHRDLHGRPTTVADVATRWGFWHLGRFSRYYRDLFACSPSETLRRSRSPAHQPG